MDRLSSFSFRPTTMASDATAVHQNFTVRESQRSQPAPPVTLNLNPPDYVKPRGVAVADNTAVARRPVVKKETSTILGCADPKLREALKDYRPRQETIRSISKDEWDRNVEYTKKRETEERSQEYTNNVANLDPFAAGVNGYTRGGDGNWSKTGIGPLEGVALMAPAPRAVNLGFAAYNSYKAVKDPSLLNIVGAGVSVFAAGAGERMRALEGTAQNAEHVLQAENSVTSLQKLNRANSAVHKFEKGVLVPAERVEGGFKNFEFWHLQQEKQHEE